VVRNAGNDDAGEAGHRRAIAPRGDDRNLV
jgi:hypothetical protein